jgi:predicted peptidase
MRRLSIFLAVLLSACAALGIDPAEFEPLPRPVASDTTTRLASGTWVSPAGTRLRFSIVVPPMIPGDKLPLVVALHGLAPTGDTVPAYFGLRALESLFGPALRPLGALIVAPDAPGNNWTDPIAERALLALVDEMKRRYPVDTQRTLLTGISTGGMGTWFIAHRHPRAFRAAIPLTSFPVIRHTTFNRAALAAVFDEMVRDRGVSWAAPFREIPVYAIHSRMDENFSFASESTLVVMIKARGGLVDLVAVDSLNHGPPIAYQGALRSSVYWIRRQWDRPLTSAPSSPAKR